MTCPVLSSFDFGDSNYDFKHNGGPFNLLPPGMSSPDIILPSEDPLASAKVNSSQKKAESFDEKPQSSDTDCKMKNQTGDNGVIKYHRIAEVRKCLGYPLEKAAKKLHISLKEAKRQEDPTTNLHINQLINWSRVLDEPVWYLLCDSDVITSYNNRANMILMVKSINCLWKHLVQKYPKDEQTEKLIGDICNYIKMITDDEQFIEDAKAWPKVGKAHQAKESGRIVKDPRDPQDWT